MKHQSYWNGSNRSSRPSGMFERYFGNHHNGLGFESPSKYLNEKKAKISWPKISPLTNSQIFGQKMEEKNLEKSKNRDRRRVIFQDFITFLSSSVCLSVHLSVWFDAFLSLSFYVCQSGCLSYTSLFFLFPHFILRTFSDSFSLKMWTCQLMFS